MPRNISASMTEAQVRAKIKDVTRRMGWLSAYVGQILNVVRKAMGLKKGEKIVQIAQIRLTNVRREPLRRMLDEPAYGAEECRREGFPDMTPVEFVAFFCAGHKGCTPESEVTRLEFEYL